MRLNILLLMAVSFLPFPTGLMAEALQRHRVRRAGGRRGLRRERGGHRAAHGRRVALRRVEARPAGRRGRSAARAGPAPSRHPARRPLWRGAVRWASSSCPGSPPSATSSSRPSPCSRRAARRGSPCAARPRARRGAPPLSRRPSRLGSVSAPEEVEGCRESRPKAAPRLRSSSARSPSVIRAARRPPSASSRSSVPAGEICVLIGPSGSGKTTAMKMVNRLIDITEGDITHRRAERAQPRPDRAAARHRLRLPADRPVPAHERGGQHRRPCRACSAGTRQRIRARVGELLELVGLEQDDAKRYPGQFSGGQRQRIGVARAMAADQPLMLMDEPFGAIDPITRDRLQNDFLRLHAEVRKTVIFVTHDIDEAIKMGHRIAILRDGELVQYDTPDEHPRRARQRLRRRLRGRRPRAQAPAGCASWRDIELDTGPTATRTSCRPSTSRRACATRCRSMVTAPGADVAHGAARAASARGHRSWTLAHDRAADRRVRPAGAAADVDARQLALAHRPGRPRDPRRSSGAATACARTASSAGTGSSSNFEPHVLRRASSSTSSSPRSRSAIGFVIAFAAALVAYRCRAVETPIDDRVSRSSTRSPAWPSSSSWCRSPG